MMPPDSGVQIELATLGPASEFATLGPTISLAWPNTNAGEFILEQIKTTYREFWADMKSAPWRLMGSWSLFLGWIATLTSVMTILCSQYNRAEGHENISACRADGTFTPFDPSLDNYSYWWASGFFQITIAFGRLPFSQAKIADIAWDLVSPPECPQPLLAPSG